MKSKKVKSIEQKGIVFQDREITAVMVQDENGRENVYVPLRPLVEGMGLAWSGQYERIKKNPVLNDVCTSVRVTRTQGRNMLSIPISHLNGFLFGINANRVKPEIRPLLVEYQAKCYEVLFSAFNGTESMKRFYNAIGHDEGWIGKRIEKHSSSTDLGDFWLINGVPIEYHDDLQSVISKGLFGVSIQEHRQLKNLPEEANLRDNMTRMELLFSAIGDETALEIGRRENPTSLDENTQIADYAGKAAGDSMKLIEDRIGKKILSAETHLDKKRPSLGKNDKNE